MTTHFEHDVLTHQPAGAADARCEFLVASARFNLAGPLTHRLRDVTPTVYSAGTTRGSAI